MKLAVYSDQVFWRHEGSFSTNEAYTLFPASFGEVVEEVGCFGRLAPGNIPGRHVISAANVQLQPLPFYQDLYQLWKCGPRLFTSTRQAILARAGNWDVAWVCGPGPMAQLVAKAFLEAGKPVFLVVRQNLVRLVAASNEGLRRWVAVVAACICEAEFRRLARQQTVFCVGDEITALYRQVTDRARKHLPSLVRYSDVLAAGRERSSRSVFPRLLCVGRLSREKGFSYAIDAISMLHDLGKEISLEIIGAGPMEEELRDHCRRRNVGRFVSFSGYIPYGPGLMERYRSAFALVVPSLTEGVSSGALRGHRGRTANNCFRSRGDPWISSGIGERIACPASSAFRHRASRLELDTVELLLLPVARKCPDKGQQLHIGIRARADAECHPGRNPGRSSNCLCFPELILMQRQPRRSALLTCPGGEVPRQPTVAVVVPLFNESKWVREAVSGVLRQDYPNLREIWLVDGRSTDGTRQQLEEVKARDPRIRVADNPLRVQAAALNIALERTSCDLIMRIDAHAIFAPGAVSQSVSLLLSTGAAVAGPVMHVHSGHGVWEAAIKSALDSALGAGVARFHRANAHGWADTAWCGCYWRHVLLEVGPWREDLPRTEDNNMNARVREAGYGVFLSNTIQAWYAPGLHCPDWQSNTS